MTPQIYPNFNTLMNIAIQTEKAMAEEKKDNKHKFMEQRARQQDRFQRQKNSNYSGQKTQAPMHYRTQSSASHQPNPSYKTKGNVKTQQNNTGQVTNNTRACFNCHDPGHFIANCPYANNKLAASIFSNSVNGPRPVVTGANRVPINNNTNKSQQMRQPQQSFGRARVNHINTQEAQNAQGVVLGEFLVGSILATVLFDSGASHLFISSSFVEKHNISTVLLKLPLLTRMPGADIHC